MATKINSAIVRFQRQIDAAPDFVRVYNVKTRLDAVVAASAQVRGGLLMKDITGVELRRTSLVAA